LKRILITGTGGDVATGIVKCILSEMSEAVLFSCDIKSIIPYLNKFEKHFIIPRYEDENYWLAIQAICLEHKITHFFPTTEPEILIANKHRIFFNDNNILLVINNEQILDIATSKYKTALFLKNNGICVPDTYLPSDLPDILEYPLIVKPDFGRGSASVVKINNYDELKSVLKNIPSPVIQKYIGTEEQEFTVGVFSDGQTTRTISFRRRLGMGNMSVFVEIAQDTKLDNIAHTISNIFHLKGSINIQLRYFNDSYYVFEINPRISSTVAFRHQMGFQDAIWWLQLLSGEHIKDYHCTKSGTMGIKVAEEHILHPPFNILEYSRVCPPPPPPPPPPAAN